MLRKKTQIVYLPLIDKAPADPATITSALLKAQAVTGATGQEYVIFTADQQLYKVAVHVMWENQALFSNVYLRLGGLHLLMSYVGSIGSLIAASGMTEILSEAFAGVLKMLTGKKYPDNVRALRMLVELFGHCSKHKTWVAWLIFSRHWMMQHHTLGQPNSGSIVLLSQSSPS